MMNDGIGLASNTTKNYRIPLKETLILLRSDIRDGSVDLVHVKGTELWHFSDLGQSWALTSCCVHTQEAKTTRVGITTGTLFILFVPFGCVSHCWQIKIPALNKNTHKNSWKFTVWCNQLPIYGLFAVNVHRDWEAESASDTFWFNNHF